MIVEGRVWVESQGMNIPTSIRVERSDRDEVEIRVALPRGARSSDVSVYLTRVDAARLATLIESAAR